MDNFAKGKPSERQAYFEETAARLTSTTTAVEKDFWICWTLKHLFTLESVPELRFKGGTSLSKVFRLIERFSEDIDISIDRAALGFSGERDLPIRPSLARSAKRSTRTYGRRSSMKSTPNPAEATGSLSTHPWSPRWDLSPSKDENEEMTLVFHYPHAFEYSKYLQPQIKIEFGRGDQQPSEMSPVTPFVAEAFPRFFEKVNCDSRAGCREDILGKGHTLTCGEPPTRPSKLKPRMARHWSDVAVMSTAERFGDEKLSLELLDPVIRFKKIYFAANWAQYDTAVPDTLRIVPHKELQVILRKDYQQMEEMFPTRPLTFDEILERLGALEVRINAMEKK